MTSQKVNEYKQFIKKACGLTDNNIDNLHLQEEDLEDLFARLKEYQREYHKLKPKDNLNCDINIVEKIESEYNAIREKMKEYFYPLPSGERAEIKIVNSDILGPHFDGKGLVINPNKCELLQNGILPLLIMHELEPGHFYFSQQLNGKLPEPNDALIEGWSLYVEDFCPVSLETQSGILVSKIIRFVRVIGDVLYHTGQFTESQLRDFFQSEFPFPNRIEEEIKRIKTMKGYAMCYIFGEQFYAFLNEEYSSKFSSLKEYHKFLFEGLRKMTNEKRTDIQFLLDYFADLANKT